MPSTLTWLAHSETERQKALDVIDLFRERDTVDELGIGQVRDVFSDLLFPGTSTIQTRAGYFLFVPWMYRRLEELRVPSDKIEGRARREEIRLIDPLAGSEDPEGTFGIAAGAALKRLPSNVYWGGLGKWKLRRFPGSQSQYHRSLDGFYAALDRWERAEGEREDPRPRNWHPGLPDPPPGFPGEASFRLRGEDARYLQERILATVTDSLLAYLVGELAPFEDVEAPWLLLQVVDLPHRLAEQLRHARNFSDVIRGAPFLYNLLLGERAEDEGVDVTVDDEPPVERYRTRLAEWAAKLESRQAALEAWDRGDFWRIVEEADTRVSAPARRFVEEWFERVLDGPGPRKVDDDPRARTLIRNREHRLKGGRARLFSRRALEMWSGEAGVARLDYRWSVVQTLVLDILRGLEAEGPRA